MKVEMPAPVAKEEVPEPYRLFPSTLIFTFVLGVVFLALNLRAPAIVECKTIEKEIAPGQNATVYATAIRGRGWPFPKSQTIESPDPIAALQEFNAGSNQQPLRNAAACLVLMFGAGAACELLLRRAEES